MLTVHHVGYLVNNIDKSIKAFTYLGYKTDKPVKNDDIRLAKIAFISKEKQVIELIQPYGKESPIYALMEHYRNSPYHICYLSDDFNHDLNELADNGFMIFREAEKAPCLGDGKGDVVFLMHPAIGIIEVYDGD